MTMEQIFFLNFFPKSNSSSETKLYLNVSYPNLLSFRPTLHIHTVVVINCNFLKISENFLKCAMEPLKTYSIISA